ncbi:copper transporter [Escherichia coli]|nr:copper transporter [Escherichia coli]EGD4800962.1 copper transporter [Escherichia coli]EGD4991234.1 copper transporter [Escherichia coli]
MAIAYWQNDYFVIFLSPENQSLASKVGSIKSPEIMSLCLLVNFCHFVWPLR